MRDMRAFERIFAPVNLASARERGSRRRDNKRPAILSRDFADDSVLGFFPLFSCFFSITRESESFRPFVSYALRLIIARKSARDSLSTG